MAKGLSSFPEERRTAVATRRLNGLTHGNGFWGAKDYFVKKGMRLPGKLGAMEDLKKALENIQHDENGTAKGFSTGGDDVRQRNSRTKAGPRSGSHSKGNHRRKTGGVSLASVWPNDGKARSGKFSGGASRTPRNRGSRQLATR